MDYKITINKSRKLELIGELPENLNGEVILKVKVWVDSVEQPIKQEEDDDATPIVKTHILDGCAEVIE